MKDYDFRPTCQNCNGEGGFVSLYSQGPDWKYDFESNQYTQVCCVCEGSGRGPYTETVEIEDTQ